MFIIVLVETDLPIKKNATNGIQFIYNNTSNIEIIFALLPEVIALHI